MKHPPTPSIKYALQHIRSYEERSLSGGGGMFSSARGLECYQNQTLSHTLQTLHPKPRKDACGSNQRAQKVG